MPHVLLDSFGQSVAARTHGYVGADLIAVCTEAGMQCIKNGVKNKIPGNLMRINQKNIEDALTVVHASAMREVRFTSVLSNLRSPLKRQKSSGTILGDKNSLNENFAKLCSGQSVVPIHTRNLESLHRKRFFCM